MTKKSLARLERDAKKKLADAKVQETIDTTDPFANLEEFYNSNTCWTDLEQLYTKLAHQLAHNFSTLIESFKIPGVIQFLETDEYKETLVIFKTIQRDFNSMTELLTGIHASHKDKTGNAKDQEETSETIRIFEEYNQYVSRYDSIITPSYMLLMEKIGLALGKISAIGEEHKKAQEDLDITIVKDVEFREVRTDESK